MDKAINKNKKGLKGGKKKKETDRSQLCNRPGFNAPTSPSLPLPQFFHLISQAQGLPQNNQCLLDTPLAAGRGIAGDFTSGNLQTQR